MKRPDLAILMLIVTNVNGGRFELVTTSYSTRFKINLN